ISRFFPFCKRCGEKLAHNNQSAREKICQEPDTLGRKNPGFDMFSFESFRPTLETIKSIVEDADRN
uniref:hypothetical protein n=1 Tax=Gemmiger sp. TaxID=2049027 RepID=UPI0040262A32